MAEENGIYKGDKCGNIVSVIVADEGELVCCDEPMKLLEEKTKEQEGNEKHVPVIEREGNTVKVKIGAAPHPMEKEHYIQWIEINMVDAGRIGRVFLKPGDAPEAEFHARGKTIKIRAFCNVHGLWKSE